MESVPEPVKPCEPSPCGPNSECRVVGDQPSCSCLPDFIGTPPNCRPECVSNSECASHLACINRKCRDPCPGTCGQNAECRVISHTPNCVCLSGYIGDPFAYCSLPPCKIIFISEPFINCSTITNAFDAKLIPHWLEYATKKSYYFSHDVLNFSSTS